MWVLDDCWSPWELLRHGSSFMDRWLKVPNVWGWVKELWACRAHKLWTWGWIILYDVRWLVPQYIHYMMHMTYSRLPVNSIYCIVKSPWYLIPSFSKKVLQCSMQEWCLGSELTARHILVMYILSSMYGWGERCRIMSSAKGCVTGSSLSLLAGLFCKNTTQSETHQKL